MKWADLLLFLSIFSFLTDKDISRIQDEFFINKRYKINENQYKGNQDGTNKKNDIKVKEVKKFKRKVDNQGESKYQQQ